VDPHLTQQCLDPPHAPPQTAAPTVEALSHTDAVKSSLVTMARPKFAPKVPISVDRCPNLTTCLIIEPVRPMMPNGIRIRNAVFLQCTGQIDRLTDAQTERSSKGKFDHYRPLRSEGSITLDNTKQQLLLRIRRRNGLAALRPKRRMVQGELAGGLWPIL